MRSEQQLSVWSRRGRTFGVTVLLGTVLASVGWASMAPIGGAIVARGTLVVDGERQKVQYRDGGRIKQIHVGLGDHVTAGQVLVTFDVPELEIKRRQHVESLKSLDRQSAINADELKGVRKLYDIGLANKQRYLSLQREQAQLSGNTEDTRLKLQETDVLIENAKLRPPGSGRVVELAHTTPGGVVRSGDKIIELVPDGAKLVIDARIDVSQIDDVKLGAGVEIRLSGLNQKTTPTIRGKLVYVGPDALVDERTQVHYFQIRVSIDPANLERFKLGAGMPVEVMVETGKRTVIEYALRPLSDSIARSMREPL